MEQGRWNELNQWVGSRPAMLKTAAGRALALSHRPWAVNKVMNRTHKIHSKQILTRTLTAKGHQWLKPYLKPSYPWEFDSYIQLHQSIRERVLADWVTVRAEEETRQAAFHDITKAFPLLDEKLISTLLQQDPALFGEGIGRGRLLHRKAFAPFLPTFLHNNPDKAREPDDLEERLAKLVKEKIKTLENKSLAISNWHPHLFTYWDINSIRNEINNVLSSRQPSLALISGAVRGLSTLTALSYWWESLDG